ncbi:MAG: hypothetical protein AAGI90_03935 [Chlamydiota bacterium]
MNEEAKKVSSDPIGPKGASPQKLPPNPEEFRSMMRSTNPKAAQSGNIGDISPMELAQKSIQPGGASLESISNNVAGSDAHLTNIEKTLKKNPNLRFKRQHEQLLKQKLQDGNNHLRKMNTKLGAEAPHSPNPNGQNGPVARFLGYVTNGQNQLLAAKARIEEMGKDPNQLNPANLLAAQIQAAQAQQNLEYSSILLSKVVETFKQMLNIQL